MSDEKKKKQDEARAGNGKRPAQENAGEQKSGMDKEAQRQDASQTGSKDKNNLQQRKEAEEQKARKDKDKELQEKEARDRRAGVRKERRLRREKAEDRKEAAFNERRQRTGEAADRAFGAANEMRLRREEAGRRQQQDSYLNTLVVNEVNNRRQESADKRRHEQEQALKIKFDHWDKVVHQLTRNNERIERQIEGIKKSIERKRMFKLQNVERRLGDSQAEHQRKWKERGERDDQRDPYRGYL